MNEEHTIVALVQDKPGVLNRVSSMFRRRGFNISSLAVGHSETLGFSRMTFVVDGDDGTVDQVTKQLYKLIDVVKVSDISEEDVVIRELALIKVRTTASTRPEVLQLVEIFRSNIVDVSPDSVIIEVTGDEDKVDSLLRILRPFGIREVMRTGRVGLMRGMNKSLALDSRHRPERGNAKSDGAD
jgi:acetolactate synthase-1/3 small subunit